MSKLLQKTAKRNWKKAKNDDKTIIIHKLIKKFCFSEKKTKKKFLWKLSKTRENEENDASKKQFLESNHKNIKRRKRDELLRLHEIVTCRSYEVN